MSSAHRRKFPASVQDCHSSVVKAHGLQSEYLYSMVLNLASDFFVTSSANNLHFIIIIAVCSLQSLKMLSMHSPGKLLQMCTQQMCAIKLICTSLHIHSSAASDLSKSFAEPYGFAMWQPGTTFCLDTYYDLLKAVLYQVCCLPATNKCE